MKREKLRRRIALCIVDYFGRNRLTLANVKRYVTSQLLSLYSIRSSTKITDADLAIALEMVKKALRSNPTQFRYAPRGSPIGIERERYFLHTPITELI